MTPFRGHLKETL